MSQFIIIYPVQDNTQRVVNLKNIYSINPPSKFNNGKFDLSPDATEDQVEVALECSTHLDIVKCYLKGDIKNLIRQCLDDEDIEEEDDTVTLAQYEELLEKFAELEQEVENFEPKNRIIAACRELVETFEFPNQDAWVDETTRKHLLWDLKWDLRSVR